MHPLAGSVSPETSLCSTAMNRTWPGRTAPWIRPPIAEITRQAAHYRTQGKDLIDLGQAILGLAPAENAKQRVRDYLEIPGPQSYSPDPGLPELRQAIAHLLIHRKAVSAACAERVMVTCGASQAFANALFTVTNPGDEIITFEPGYFDHNYAIAMASCRQVPVALRLRENSYDFDLEAVVSALTPHTRAIVLVSPANPTGAVACPSFVERLCDLCRSRDIWLLSDETYDLFTFSPYSTTSPAAVDPTGKVMVLGSFSKTLGLAGWRIGYLYGPEPAIEEAYKVQDSLVVCASVASQHAALGALECLDSYVSFARQELTKRKDTLVSVLRAVSSLRPRMPRGATFLLATLEDQQDDIAFCHRLLAEAGVIAVPGSAFGPHGKGTIRLSFGNLPCESIQKAGERIKKMG